MGDSLPLFPEQASTFAGSVDALYLFFVAVTATFRVVYVFPVLEIGTRRIPHWNTTEHI